MLLVLKYFFPVDPKKDIWFVELTPFLPLVLVYVPVQNDCRTDIK